ncbi:MAG: TonB-dependent receptor [Chitinophagaceae bacterium]|nr:MAG: TonB-dependent receptor [Chitinophagaceae bacterium]
MRKFTSLLLAMALLCSQTFAQTREIVGKITDIKDGAPLAGVTVKAKESSNSTISASDGSFRLNVPASVKNIIFTFVGYQETEATVTELMNITMSQADRALSEVVVVGYGTTLKRDVVSSTVRVKGAEVANTPVPNFNQALQGRAAGVFVEANSGKVGEGVKIRIRGSGSLSGGNEPLYVIDGIPINTSSLSGNALADINFNDIESFDILKDAAATAIYGSRGANGVVLITTKKGKSGKTVFQVNSQYGWNRPTNKRKFLNAEEYVTLIRESATNRDIIGGVTPGAPGSRLTRVEGVLDEISGGTDWRNFETNTNWEDQAFNPNASTSMIDISASGGNEKTRFYISGSYNNQDGILIDNTFKRISSRLNLEHSVNDRFRIGVNLSVSQTTSGRVSADNQFSTPMQLVALAPITPVRDADGKLNNIPVTTYQNAMVDAEEGQFISKVYRNIGNIYGTYKLLPWLSFTSEFGIDLQNQNDDEFYGANTTFGNGTNGYGESSWYRSLNYNTNNYFSINKTINENHSLDATVGIAYQEYDYNTANVFGQEFPLDALRLLASAGEITGGSSNSERSSFLSYFARANYKFRDRYLLGLSGRIDGSSKFGADNQYGVFPAVSAGWVLSEENFLSGSNFLDFLKVRASWGVAGNAQIDNFLALGLWGVGRYGGTSTLGPTQLANAELKWEKSNQFDVGLDFGILDNRITGEIDYYIRKTNDLLYNVPVPSNSGFSTQFRNVGSMENRGLEFAIHTDNIRGKSFQWKSSFNLAFNRNKVTKLDGEQTIIPGNDGRYLNSLIVGESIGVFYGPRYAGVDPANGDALYFTADGKTTTNDYNEAGDFIVGNPNPDVIGGFTNTFSYKGFELSVLLQGVAGNQIMNGAGGFMSASFDYYDNQTREILSRWQKPGDVTNEPQLRFLLGNGTSASSRYIDDGDYIRVKNITLGYTLPRTFISKLKLSSVRVYATAVNLFTITNYNGWDPEVNTDYRAGNRNQGADFYAAPQIRNISVGLNVGF